MYKNQKWFKNYKTFLSPFELKHEPCTGLLTILTACRFYDDITVHGFTFGTQSDNKHRLSGYYRDSELISDDSGSLVHPEDELWYSERNTKIIGDRSESIKKRGLVDGPGGYAGETMDDIQALLNSLMIGENMLGIGDEDAFLKGELVGEDQYDYTLGLSLEDLMPGLSFEGGVRDDAILGDDEKFLKFIKSF